MGVANGRQSRARASGVVLAGFVVMASYVGFVGLTVAGDTMVDPGGWKGLALTAAWLLPMLLLCVLAYFRPSVAVPVLAVAACVPVVLGALELWDYARWQAWEERTGPVSLVLALVVAAAAAVVGLSRPTAAGILMLVVAVVPVALAAIGAGADWLRPVSIGLVLAPVVASAVLFLIGGRRGVRASARTHFRGVAH